MKKCLGMLFCALCMVLAGWSVSLGKGKKARMKGNSFTVSVIHEGLLDCFPAGLTRKKHGKKVPLTCEISAAIYDGVHVWLANDKAVPGKNRSAVFRLRRLNEKPYLKWARSRYLLHKHVLKARKFEDFALTPDRRYVFLTTGFDRIFKTKKKWDKYNRLLYWRAGQARPEVHVVKASLRDPKTHDIPLRSCFSKALRSKEFPKGAPYFKVEGLVALPGNKLIFGVREHGAKYTAFQYSVKLISIDYKVKKGRISLGKRCELIYDATFRTHKAAKKQVGVSSLTYDPQRKAIYILTSYELHGGEMGAYLWRLALKDLKNNRAPVLARTQDGKPLAFRNKGEAVAMLDAKTLLIVHDDDRALTRASRTQKDQRETFRKPYQAAYAVLRIH